MGRRKGNDFLRRESMAKKIDEMEQKRGTKRMVLTVTGRKQGGKTAYKGKAEAFNSFNAKTCTQERGGTGGDSFIPGLNVGGEEGESGKKSVRKKERKGDSTEFKTGPVRFKKKMG